MDRSLLLCLTLATVSVLQQAEPQRVERLTEYRWCVTGQIGTVERRWVLRIDGHDVGEWSAERLVTVETKHPLDHLLGVGGP